MIADSISSFAARGYWKFVEKCPHSGTMFISWSFVSRKLPNEKFKSYV